MPEKGNVYKCLNPVGIQDSVELFPLAQRLDKLDGKKIYFTSRVGSEQDITIPLPKMLQAAYPNVNWHVREFSVRALAGGQPEEEMKSADAVIRAVLW